MRIPYPFLILVLPAAALLWTLGGIFAPAPSPVRTGEVPAFGLAGSAYGSLVARLMRDSLDAYWHRGQRSSRTPLVKPTAATVAAAAANPTSPPPPAAAGRFARRKPGNPAPEPPPQPPPPNPVRQEPAHGELPASPLDRLTGLMRQLEMNRTRRQGPASISAAHQRFLNASANWRLRLAYHLDPGDATLYEILHQELTRNASSPAAALKASTDLAQRAIARAKSPDGGLSDTLTGAGAGINLLNDILQSQPPGKRADKEAVSAAWGDIEACLHRYRALRQEAKNDGWWEGIPEVRREELNAHAAFLERLAARIRQDLATKGLLTQADSH